MLAGVEQHDGLPFSIALNKLPPQKHCASSTRGISGRPDVNSDPAAEPTGRHRAQKYSAA